MLPSCVFIRYRTGKHAVSVAYSYRIVITLVIADSEIHLHDVGSHDEVYR